MHMNVSAATEIVLAAAVEVSESPDAEAIAASVLMAVRDQAVPRCPIPQTDMQWGEYILTETIRERLFNIAALLNSKDK
jgi:hypothetical protein